MSPSKIERIKLLATALNTVATSCITVGIFTPLVGYFYNVGGLRSVLDIDALAIGTAGWFCAALALHLAARRVLQGLDE